LIDADVTLDWSRVRGVILDVDGTLYEQRKLRLRMLGEILRYTAFSMKGLTAIKVINRFRKNREDLARSQIRDASCLQFSLVANELDLPTELVVSIVDEWITRRPLKYLRTLRRAGVAEFVSEMQSRNIRIGVLSDYDAAPKLAALELRADATFHSLQDSQGYLKPHPFGLEAILRRLDLNAGDCVMIGDREDHDGACSAALGVPFLLCDRSTFFVDLLKCIGVQTAMRG
jgi:putative hydrolase of the HAD superfamily